MAQPHLRIRGLRLMFLGAPGVGKGTYAQRLVQQLGMPYVSSGDLLRKEVAAGTARGASIKSLIDQGAFVPDDMVEGMVLDYIDAQTREHGPETGFLLDGFPRNVAQARSLSDKGLPLDWVVNLRQPSEVIVAKLASRRICPTCGFNYNYADINTKGIVMEPLVPKVANTCDHCGFQGDFTARADDAADVVQARLDKYERETRPLEDFYGERGMLVHFDVLGGAKQYLPKLMGTLQDLERRPIA